MDEQVIKAGLYFSCFALCIFSMLLSFWGHGRMRGLFLNLDNRTLELVRKGPFLGDWRTVVALVALCLAIPFLEDLGGFAFAAGFVVLVTGGVVSVRRVREHRRLRGLDVPEQFRQRLFWASLAHLAGWTVCVTTGGVLLMALKQHL